MTLFSRRTLQRLIDENAEFLRPEQTSNHVALLNAPRPDYLSTVWEVAVLNALSKIGSVEHELGSKARKADVGFRSALLNFSADVATVSDRGADERNPIDKLEAEFRRRTSKAGAIGGFQLFVGNHNRRVYRGSDERRELKIPPVREFNREIFNGCFDGFLREIIRNPRQQRQYTVENERTHVVINYDPSRSGCGSGGHICYEYPSKVDRNVIYNTLKSKSDQLKAASTHSIRGIFLCDGDCRVLHSRMSDWASYKGSEIIQEFLRKSTSISFVMTLQVDSNYGWPRDRQLKYAPYIYFNPRLPSPRVADLKVLLDSFVQFLPKPFTNIENAALQGTRPRRRIGEFFGGFEMSDRTVKISAISLLQLLAGQISHEEFSRAYDFPGGNLFTRMLAEGRSITEAKLNATEDDDDWIEFKFRPFDPVLAPFRVPKKPE